MYDIKPLEEEWKQYKKNKRKPYYIGVLAFVGILIGIFYFLNYKNLSLPKFSAIKSDKTTSVSLEKHSSLLLDDALDSIQIKKQEVIEDIKPVVKLNSEKPKVIEANIPTLPVLDDIPVLDEKPKRQRVRRKPKVVKYKKPQVEKPRKKMHLNIIESSSVSAYKDVEKRFYQSHDIDDSLFLAKSYFRKGNYKKSEYWSLQTNKINTHIEESWIIFVKSKVKLGRKNEAIRILRNYLKRSNSHVAKNLLYKLIKN